MASILSNLQENDILFVDEIHRLNRQVEEVLYPAMEDYAIDIMIGRGVLPVPSGWIFQNSRWWEQLPGQDFYLHRCGIALE